MSGEEFYGDDAAEIFIRPNPFNPHVVFHDFLQHVRNIPGELKGTSVFFVEDAGYQKAAIQEFSFMSCTDKLSPTQPKFTLDHGKK